MDKKVAIVTGGSRGIGRTITQTLLNKDYQVIAVARDSKALEQLKAQLDGVDVFQADISEPEQAASMVGFAKDKYGRLDALVCNVGSGRSVPPGEETFAEWHRVFSQNFFSTTNCVEAAKSCLATHKGSVVCISSICGNEVIPGAPVTYSVAKSALNAYVKGVARALAKDSIRINAISPGNILFEGSVWDKKLAENPAVVEEMLNTDVPLQRFGTPEEISQLVCYLLSENASFVTGSVVTIDGGQTRS